MKTKIYNVPAFDVNSVECPLCVKIVLRQQIRDLFQLRRCLRGKPMSNAAIDKLIDSWWSVNCMRCS